MKALWNVFSAFSMQPPSDGPELAPEDMADDATSGYTAGAGARPQLVWTADVVCCLVWGPTAAGWVQELGTWLASWQRKCLVDVYGGCPGSLS